MRPLACLLVVAGAGCNLLFSAEPDEPAEPDASEAITELIVVPSDGRMMVSQNILPAGKTFRITASGTYMTSGSSVADAEYYNTQATPNDKDNDPAAGLIDVGIAIDDDTIDGVRTPRWGAYRDDHIYVIQFQGVGERIHVRLHDGVYTNNTGEMLLTIESI